MISFKVKSIAVSAFSKTDVKAVIQLVYKRPIYKTVFEHNSQKSDVTLLAAYLDNRPVAYYSCVITLFLTRAFSTISKVPFRIPRNKPPPLLTL